MIHNILILILFFLILILIDNFIIIPVINLIYRIYCYVNDYAYDDINFQFIKSNIDDRQPYLYYLFINKYKNYVMSNKDLKSILEFILLDLETNNYFKFKAIISIYELNDTNKEFNLLCKPFIITNFSDINFYEEINSNIITTLQSKRQSYLILVNVKFI